MDYYHTDNPELRARAQKFWSAVADLEESLGLTFAVSEWYLTEAETDIVIEGKAYCE